MKTSDEYEESSLPMPKTKDNTYTGTAADRGNKGDMDRGPHMPAAAEKTMGMTGLKHAVSHLESMPHGHRTKV